MACGSFRGYKNKKTPCQMAQRLLYVQVQSFEGRGFRSNPGPSAFCLSNDYVVQTHMYIIGPFSIFSKPWESSDSKDLAKKP